jgi:signal transduction histidine kinase
MPLNLSAHRHPPLPASIVVTAMDLMPDPIVITTPDGVIIYVNIAAKDLFQGAGNLQQLSGSSLIETSMRQWLGGSDWNQILYRMRSGECNLEVKLNLTPQAQTVAIALRQIEPTPNQTANLDSRPELWLWRIQDLTPQQQQQAEWIERTAQLERSSRHMSEFLSNMSHELRTPLTSILGFSSLLKQQIFGELNEKQSIYIRQIHHSGQYLLALINDILDLSKIEAGQMTLEHSSLSATRLCKESIESVQQQSQLKHLSVRTQFETAIAPLWADEVRVRQMVLNLLSNAIKFSPDGGTIEVRTQQQDDLVWIEVQDYGIGIEAEKQHLIFKPFQQVDNSIERRRQGTGLGLALTKHLAELHGGTVSFTSEMGVGSCFVLKLPIKSEYGDE